MNVGIEEVGVGIYSKSNIEKTYTRKTCLRNFRTYNNIFWSYISSFEGLSYAIYGVAYDQLSDCVKEKESLNKLNIPRDVHLL